MTTPEPELSDAQIVNLVKHAAKCSAAIYIAADKVVADDISETLRNLVVALNQSRRKNAAK